MKFVAAFILFAALIAATQARVTPTPPNHCDYKCNAEDLPVYVYNGRCYLKFEGKCNLEKYNCLNPHKAFRVVSKELYSADAAPRCQSKDY